jgi:hypothetical protein
LAKGTRSRVLVASVAGSRLWRSLETSVEWPSSPVGEERWSSGRP